MDASIFVAGFGVGLSLIVAIGAQNAFVLRQGLKGEHVFAVCLTCALSDAILIAVGVSGFAKAASAMPWLRPAMGYGGAAFLIWYGGKSLHSALRSRDALVVNGATTMPGLWRTVSACLAITWINPHVYLDTVVLLGSISTQYGGQQTMFAAGAMTGSFIFFFSLGYGARWLRPLFATPLAWRLLEGIIAIVMWTIAFRLLSGF